jgi:diazepam-binding inhibitor (GABA receptor modulating acyl-CoA-binding protein)
VKIYNEKQEYTLNIMPTKKTELEENFEVAVQAIKDSDPNAKNQPTDEEKLQLYGLYKQVILGDCNIPQPWALQVTERAKWNAWNSKKGMTKQDAMLKYCELYLDITDKYGM